VVGGGVEWELIGKYPSPLKRYEGVNEDAMSGYISLRGLDCLIARRRSMAERAFLSSRRDFLFFVFCCWTNFSSNCCCLSNFSIACRSFSSFIIFT